MEAQVRAAVDLGAPVIELHTGAFANATGEAQAAELARLRDAAVLAAKPRVASERRARVELPELADPVWGRSAPCGS